jgi:TPR repeat protein
MNIELERKANTGDKNAMFELAENYMERTVSEEDPSLMDHGLSWLEKAAELEHPEAQFQLGGWYINTNEDERGFYWIEKAANNGHMEAQRILNEVDEKLGEE